MCGNIKFHQVNVGTESKPEYRPDPTFLELLMRLIDFIGLDTIMTTALENKPMKSLLGDKRTKGFVGGKFGAVTLESLFSLECNIDKLRGKNRLQHGIVRIMLYFVQIRIDKNTDQNLKTFQTCLLLCDEFDIPSSLWLPVAAIFLKLDLVLCFNNRVIDTFKANFISGTTPLKTRGQGFCLASSLVNHSCDPNMYIITYGTSSVFRARRPISKGEQLTMIYANPATIYTYSARQKQLLQNYMFVCR